MERLRVSAQHLDGYRLWEPSEGSSQGTRERGIRQVDRETRRSSCVTSGRGLRRLMVRQEDKDEDGGG